jgi:ABC-type amino acid transport substrate-binding protein
MSEERRAVVDFTEQFMKFDTELLMKKPSASNSSTPKIASLADLEAQNVVAYGVIRNGVTETFFRYLKMR